MSCAFDEADIISRINDLDVSVRLGGVQGAISLQANTPAIITAIKGRINGPTSEFVYVSGSPGQAVINTAITALGVLGDADLVSTTDEDYLAGLIGSPPIINQSRNAEPTSFQYDGAVASNNHAIDSELMIFQTSNYNFNSIGAILGDTIVIRGIHLTSSPINGVWTDRTNVNNSPVYFNTTSPEDVATRNSIITTMKTYAWTISSVSDDGFSVTLTRNPTTQPFKVTDLSGGAYVDVTGHYFQVSGTPSDYIVYFSAIRLDAVDYALYSSGGTLKYESYVPAAPVVDVNNSLFNQALTKAGIADALTDMAARKYVKPSTISGILNNLQADALVSTNPELEVSAYATATLTLANKASRRYDADTANVISADIKAKFYSAGSPELGCPPAVQAGEDPTNSCVLYFSPIVAMHCANLSPVYLNKPVAFLPTIFDSSGNLAVDFGESTINHNSMIYYWNFGDGSYSTAPAPLHVYTEAGTYEATLVVTDLVSALSQEGFCSIDVTAEFVTVDVPPYVVPGYPFCITVTYNFSESLTIMPFDIAVDGNGCYEVTLPSPGTVCGTVGPTEFCVTAVDPLSLNLVSDAVNCPNVAKSFTVTITGGLEPYTYVWTVDGVLAGSVSDLLTEPFNVGSHSVSVLVTDAMGMTISGSVDFVIYPRADAYINYNISNLSGNGRIRMPGYTVDLAPCIISAGDPSQYIYAWDFGDGLTGTGPDQTHTYAKPGKYQVSLKITDPSGCSEILDVESQVQIYGPPKIMLQKVDEDKSLCPGKITVEGYIGDGLAPYVLVADMGDSNKLYPVLGPGNTFSFEHFYASAGRYVIQVTATDALTISAYVLSITVNVG